VHRDVAIAMQLLATWLMRRNPLERRLIFDDR
jgi:hypothetical protein